MNRRRTLILATLPLVMAAGVVGGQAALASTTQAAKPQTCILGIICLGGGSSSSPTASPSPSYSLPTCLPTALPTALPSLPASILKKLKALPQCLASALPTKLPALPGVPTSLPTLPGLPTSLPTVPGLPTALPSGSGKPGPGGSGSGSGKGKSSTKDPKAKSAAGGYGIVAPTAISVLSGDSATLVDFKYVGNAKVPTATGGTVTMMKFTASSLTLSGHAQDAVTEDGVTATTSSPTIVLDGNVVLYATKLSGTLEGIPLTFTPTTVSKLLLTTASIVTSHTTIMMTSVTTDQALATADSLTYEPTLSVTLS